MCNVSPLIATDWSKRDRTLELFPDRNWDVIREMSQRYRTVCCWGDMKNDQQLLKASHRVSAIVNEAKCFGVNETGQPTHPLMLSYATELVDWP